jgi:uracil-DNA glycosylase
LLIVGQDFGDVNYFRINKGHDEEGNETNINLLRLLRHIGLTPETPPQPDQETRVFLTNSILCLKEPPMNSRVLGSWIRSCAIEHLRPLVCQLRPPIVVAMGASAWMAVRYALSLNQVPLTLSESAGGKYYTSTGMQVFAVGHCSALGQANRPWTVQLEDWSRIGNSLRLIE